MGVARHIRTLSLLSVAGVIAVACGGTLPAASGSHDGGAGADASSGGSGAGGSVGVGGRAGNGGSATTGGAGGSGGRAGSGGTSTGGFGGTSNLDGGIDASAGSGGSGGTAGSGTGGSGASGGTAGGGGVGGDAGSATGGSGGLGGADAGSDAGTPIQQCPTSPAVLVSEPGELHGVAADGTNVYWVNRSYGEIKQRAISGGQPIVLATGLSGGDDVAVDASRVYWSDDTSDGNISSEPIGGGTIVSIGAHLYYPSGLWLVPPYLYWSAHAGGNISRYGDAGTEVLTNDADYLAGLAVADGVYWSDQSLSVVKELTSQGTVKTVAINQNGPTDIATDGTTLYWTQKLGNAVMTMPIQGTSPTALVTGLSNPIGIWVYADCVFWTEGANGNGVIKWMKK